MALCKRQVYLIPPRLADNRGGRKGLHALLRIVHFRVRGPEALRGEREVPKVNYLGQGLAFRPTGPLLHCHSPKVSIYLLLGRGEGREKERQRNIDVRDKHGSMASPYVPRPGPEPATQARALTRNQTTDLSLCGMMANSEPHWSGLTLSLV